MKTTKTLTVVARHKGNKLFSYSLADNLDEDLMLHGGTLSYVKVDMDKFFRADDDQRIKLVANAIKKGNLVQKPILTVGQLLQEIKDTKYRENRTLSEILNMPLFYTGYDRQEDVTLSIALTEIDTSSMGVAVNDNDTAPFSFTIENMAGTINIV